MAAFLLSNRRLAALVAATSILLLATGCSASDHSSTSGASKVAIENGSGVVAEYSRTVAHFPLSLPAGYSFPAAPPKALLKGQSEKGVGVGPAYFFWLCAWEASYLKADQASSSTMEATSLKEIAKWPDTYFVKTYIQDPSNGWYTAVVAPAKLGDPSGVRNDMQGGDCPAQGVPIP